jgi:uncharacterized protein YjbI with pentapeptide repeats
LEGARSVRKSTSADLTNAVLKRANFRNADLDRVNLTHAALEDARNLDKTKNLEAIIGF